MTMNNIILKKRGFFETTKTGERVLNGCEELTKEEIEFFVNGYVSGTIPDYQVSSFLMATYFNSMTFEETANLTNAMLHSGDVINLHGYEKTGLNGPFVDKHSTGGVGDKISLILAPIVASCGVQVPMMSGRALGHTGGTLDKLEAILGYNVNLTEAEFRSIISKCGFAMMGQTKKIVPADRLLYALRDVTGTVESVPLITASILSKKVAEGSDALVFDVKCGSGAFMKTVEDAKLLSQSLVKTAKVMGKNAVALITDMQTPLGRKIGNFLEIEETVECLQGENVADVMEETYDLASQMIVLAKKAKTVDEAKKMAMEAVKNGSALKKFLENVELQGGNADVLMKEVKNRRSKYRTTLKATQSGHIFIDAYKTGMAGITLGVGRSKTTDKVFADAGIILEKVSGDEVKAGDVIMEIFGKNENCLDEARAELEKAVSYSDEAVVNGNKVMEVIE